MMIIHKDRNQTEKCNDITQDNSITPPDFCGMHKPLVLAEIPYCSRNETLSEDLIRLPTTHTKLE